MLKVAARISAGEWRGFVFGLGEGGELVDVRWDWSDDNNVGASWEEDDFGFANRYRSKNNSHRESAGGVASPAPKPRRKAVEYQDPWATIGSAEEEEGPDRDDEDGHWSRSWGVD